MERSLETGASGIRQFQVALDTIGNNLANINTTSYKAGRVDFSDTLLQTLKPGTGDTANASGTAPIQVGNGAQVSSIETDFSQGAIDQTGVSTDLAINGDGYFLVKNTASPSQEVYATRAGDFHVDDNGYLVNSLGYRVQGQTTPQASNTQFPTLNGQFVSASSDILMSNASSAVLQAAPPNGPGLPPSSATAGISAINIDSSGNINVLLTDGSQYIRGQIALVRFNNPQALLKEGNNLYSGLTAGGPSVAISKGAPAQSDSLGKIESGSLEISNVDISREFTNLITAQRALQANAKVVTASDDVLQQVIGVVR